MTGGPTDGNVTSALYERIALDELLFFWNLMGGDAEAECLKRSPVEQKPPILRIPQLVRFLLGRLPPVTLLLCGADSTL